MRTNIEIDDALLKEAMALTGLTTRRATIQEALLRLIQGHRSRAAIADMAGLGLEGDLDAMREGRDFGPPE